MRVAIEAGHGGSDSGAIGPNQRYEKNDNLRFALALEQEFLRQGIEVTMTRRTDVFIATGDKCVMEHSPKCDASIAIHRNGFSNASANGVEVWAHSGAGDKIMGWASMIIAGIIPSGMVNRGAFKGMPGKPSVNFYWNAGTHAPSLLVELGFITNPKDNTLFDANFDNYVSVVAKATCTYLGVTYKEKVASELVAENKRLVDKLAALETRFTNLLADLTQVLDRYK